MSGGQVSFAEVVAAKDPTRAQAPWGTIDPARWESFLGKLDLRWGVIPQTFYEGPFLGNGGLGASVYQVGKRISFTLGHSRVRDHQPIRQSTFANGRLRIGRLDLVTRGDVTDVDLRLSLYDATLRGTINTTRGRIGITAFIDSVRDVLVVQTDPSRGERADWDFVPYAAKSSRFDFRTDDLPAGLKDNPEPRVQRDRAVQRLATGGSHTTMWRERDDTLVLTVAASYPGDTSERDAERTLGRAGGFRRLHAEHIRWWNDFYAHSFVSVPDGRVQSFYWIQLYKIASATRAGQAPIGTAAQWLEPTPWTATWWNLNVQVEYWLINATGHYELDSLTESIDTYRDNLIGNVPDKYRSDCSGIARTSQENLITDVLAEAGDPTKSGPLLELGNLTWAMHNVWLRYRHTMDEALLRDVLFPILRRSVNYMLKFLTEGSDGKLHMPRTYSPEYDFAVDCNYTLALLNWGCRTLTWSADRLGIDDELAPRWKEVVERMVAPPQGEDGFWIGADRQLTSSHRHFSHLLWFYPLYVLDVNDPKNREALERSIAHWVGFTGALQGYTFTGASSMSSQLGKGDDALRYLNTLLDEFVQPNTMYAETGPVIETPLSGAQSVHDMLISSWGDRIRVFPAAPSDWADISFHRLRTEGAFEVSASRRDGRTRWVGITSLAGEPLRVDAAGLPKSFRVTTTSGRALKHTLVDGAVEFALAKGQTAFIAGANAQLPPAIAPVGSDRYSWGKLGVTRGNTTPVDLSEAYNNDGITAADDKVDGDLGNGYTLPAEQVPSSGDLLLGDVTWTFPSVKHGAKNNLVPDGQVVSVPKGRYARINLLGMTVPLKPPAGEFDDPSDSPTTLTLTYSDGSSAQADLRISVWDKQATQGDQVAFQVAYRHSATNASLPPVNQSSRVYHQWVEVDSAKQLVSVTFGKNPAAHFFALSVEGRVRN